ncbi:hypothetical protein EDC61_1065 [Sulfuritortus calidifontis]|uniref:Uncharacterized protein n=1 Tax=Sulfuritortus calidifontis TaxID=1914471 RepID=A0A4R3JVJ0_9PROT|nr:hypothetical protein [Sulfuritortus calidifontis]TCS72091.1 hypothetical protein EDC61_1065 [Sulfuritortus calidifontis]
MAQHDYLIDNQPGAAFRADLNAALAAIVSNNSGATEPATTYPFQWWADTTSGKLKLRNAANAAWIEIGSLSDPNLGLALKGAIAASGLTMSSGKLLGRTTAGSGAVEEIIIGSGLVLSGGALAINQSAALIYDPVGLVQVQTGGGAGFYQRVDENFNPLTYGKEAFVSHATYRGIVEQIIDGQWMVKIPKFWFKAGTVPSGAYAGKEYWMISPVAKTGFTVHPAFIGAGGVELDQIWVGKYKAGYDGSSKATSVPGVAPMVSIDFPTARARAYARNTGGVSGFRLWSVYDLAAIQMLASIEMGGLDIQSLIGAGHTAGSSAVNTDHALELQASWRGLFGLWGNVWQMCDGLKRNGGTWWRWQYNVPGNTTTNDFSTGYTNTGRPALTTSGYPATFDTTLLGAGVIVPATVNGTQSDGSTGDYLYSNTSTDDRIAYYGGSWVNGADAGLFCLYVSNAPSNAYGNFGARLAKV